MGFGVQGLGSRVLGPMGLVAGLAGKLVEDLGLRLVPSDVASFRWRARKTKNVLYRRPLYMHRLHADSKNLTCKQSSICLSSYTRAWVMLMHVDYVHMYTYTHAYIPTYIADN